MWFVHRNLDGTIASMHKGRKPGYAEEQLEDTNSEVLAYLETAKSVEITTIDDVIDTLVDKGIIAKADIALTKSKKPK